MCDGTPDCSLITENDLRDEQNCGELLIVDNRLMVHSHLQFSQLLRES